MKKLTSKKQLILYGCSGLSINMLSLFMGSYLCSALQVGGFLENREYWTYLDKDIVVYALWTVLYFLAKALDGFIAKAKADYASLVSKAKATKIKWIAGLAAAGLLVGATISALVNKNKTEEV